MIRLNQQQLNFFDTFGYLALPGLMADCIDEIIDDFEQVWAERGGGHDGQRRSCIVPFIDQHERLCALLDDPRIEGLLASLLGDDFNYSGSDGNYYAGDTQWHSDDYQKEVRHVKIAFYLDHLTRDSGCLRVIPGSHRRGDQYAETLEANARQSQVRTAQQLPDRYANRLPGDVPQRHLNTANCAHHRALVVPRRRHRAFHVAEELVNIARVLPMRARWVRRSSTAIWWTPAP